VRRPELLARQAARPSGLLGALLGRIMAHETAEANRIAVELLELRPTDSVLDIGFGHGATVRRLSEIVDRGAVSGIDVSTTMLDLATRRNRDGIRRGRVDLRVGSVDQLPYPRDAFDAVLSVHTLYFWSEPQRAFAEIRKVLRPAGRLVLGWRDDPEGRRLFPASVYRFHDADTVTTMLGGAGLGPTRSFQHQRGKAILHFVVAGGG
jgi:ubiquinone/menaquinone biosynthesis C-methylase UbiE